MGDQAQTPLAGVKILIAEDEVMIGLLLEDILLTFGAEVSGPFSSRIEVLNALSEARFDLVALDVNMRGEYMYDVAITLQEQQTPFVFISGYRQLPDCPPSLYGAPRLTKPFTASELLNIIKDALPQPGES